MYIFGLCVPAVGEMDKNWQETSEMEMYAPYPYHVLNKKKRFDFIPSCEALYVLHLPPPSALHHPLFHHHLIYTT